MARFTVILPDSVAEWVKTSAKQENVSQSAFVSNMLSYAMAGISRDIHIMDLEGKVKVVGSSVVVSSREKAEKVVEALFDLLSKQGFVSVANLKDLVDIPTKFIDERWGWTKFSSVVIHQVRDGYCISLLDAEPLL